jgi:hypothetical protein
MPAYDVRFKNPSTFLLAGASQSGKTTFTLNLLRHIDVLFTDPKCKQNVIYYYKEWQDSFDYFQQEGIVDDWVNEIPTSQDFKERTILTKDRGGSIVIIDDFAADLNKDISTIFSVLSHHTNTTVFLLTQNIFSRNPAFRDISLNSTYIILFKNPRDSSQISHFAKQFAPGNSRFLVNAFKECTKAAYSYMLFDNHQSTPDVIRIRSNMLPNQRPVMVWGPNTCVI